MTDVTSDFVKYYDAKMAEVTLENIDILRGVREPRHLEHKNHVVLKPIEGDKFAVKWPSKEEELSHLLRSLDSCVSILVMRDTAHKDSEGRIEFRSSDGQQTICTNDRGPWKYTTEPNSTDRVIERLYSLGWLLTINRVVGGAIVNARQYTLPPNGDWQEAILTSGFVQEAGDTISEAVCRAALVAVAKMREPKSP